MDPAAPATAVLALAAGAVAEVAAVAAAAAGARVVHVATHPAVAEDLLITLPAAPVPALAPRFARPHDEWWTSELKS